MASRAETDKTGKRDKRQDIMQAAEELFTARRFHEITLDDVARLAKVGKGTIYLHFKDKDDLFFQAATSGFEQLCQLLHSRVPESAPFSRQLLEACAQITRFFQRRRQLFRMMEGEAALVSRENFVKRWLEHRKMLRAALSRMIAKGVREGEIRGDVPAEVLASFLLGMLRARAKELQDAAPAMRSCQTVIDVFCRGAGADGVNPR